MPTYLLSIEKVVAAMLVPANPQGSDRPDTEKIHQTSRRFAEDLS